MPATSAFESQVPTGLPSQSTSYLPSGNPLTVSMYFEHFSSGAYWRIGRSLAGMIGRTSSERVKESDSFEAFTSVILHRVVAIIFPEALISTELTAAGGLSRSY